MKNGKIFNKYFIPQLIGNSKTKAFNFERFFYFYRNNQLL